MALLFDNSAFGRNSIEFPPMSRMTGIWTNSTHDPDSDDEVILAQMIEFPDGQDPDVESDFICSHLPFQVGGFCGVFANGQGWMVVLQKAPASLSLERMNTRDPHWALADSIERALWFNYGSEATGYATYTPADLANYYLCERADVAVVSNWTVTEQLWGLLAECCNVSVADIAAGHATGCAFPDREHACQHDVFRDVFELWTTLALSPSAPDLDEEFREDTATEFLRWTRKKLKKIRRRELVRMAVDDGWDHMDVLGLPKSELINLMIEGQTRPPGVG